MHKMNTSHNYFMVKDLH